jgi:hypothetical protein
MQHQYYCIAAILLACIVYVEAFLSIAGHQLLQNTAVRLSPRLVQAPAHAVQPAACTPSLVMSNDQSSWSRRQWIAKSSAALAALSTVAASRQAQAADKAPAPPVHAAPETFTAKDGSYSFQYPGDFKSYSKLLKTHKEEVSTVIALIAVASATCSQQHGLTHSTRPLALQVNFKSESTRGYEIGLAVDPVRINSLDEFASAEEVGNRVIKVEQSKDGCLEAKLLGSR